MNYGIHERDVAALIGLLAGYGGGRWNPARLRDQLIEVVIGFGIDPDDDKWSARRRIERALRADDGAVGGELIKALVRGGDGGANAG